MAYHIRFAIAADSLYVATVPSFLINCNSSISYIKIKTEISILLTKEHGIKLIKLVNHSHVYSLRAFRTFCNVEFYRRTLF